jgi:hypothetical protein
MMSVPVVLQLVGKFPDLFFPFNVHDSVLIIVKAVVQEIQELTFSFERSKMALGTWTVWGCGWEQVRELPRSGVLRLGSGPDGAPNTCALTTVEARTISRVKLALATSLPPPFPTGTIHTVLIGKQKMRLE